MREQTKSKPPTPSCVPFERLSSMIGIGYSVFFFGGGGGAEGEGCKNLSIRRPGIH